MPKSTITFVCTECGGESLRWAGQCPHCRAWNTLQEYQARRVAKDSRLHPVQPARAMPLSEIASEDSPRTRLAWGELNRVLGGGVVPGSLVLIGGEPGVGKSTLLMHAAAQVAKRGKVLYVSGEESGQQVRMRAERLSALEPGILLLAENDLDAIGELGMEEVPDPSSAILAGVAQAAPGTVIVSVLEGTRPLLVEVQSLVNKNEHSMLRRVANGIDVNRLHMILAVLEKRIQVSF